MPTRPKRMHGIWSSQLLSPPFRLCLYGRRFLLILERREIASRRCGKRELAQMFLQRKLVSVPRPQSKVKAHCGHSPHPRSKVEKLIKSGDQRWPCFRVRPNLVMHMGCCGSSGSSQEVARSLPSSFWPSLSKRWTGRTRVNAECGTNTCCVDRAGRASGMAPISHS